MRELVATHETQDKFIASNSDANTTGTIRTHTRLRIPTSFSEIITDNGAGQTAIELGQ